MAWQTQEPVTFEDVAVYLSRVEWDSIATGQRELYRRVMLDNYELLMSLGYPGPKPDVLHRLERGEEPWVCTPQSTFRWNGPDSPPPGEQDQSNPGHDGKGRCLEEPSPGWCPGAGGCHVLGERTQPPYQGGWCVPWRLRLSRVLRKLRRQEAEVAGRAVGPLPRPGTGEAEDRGGVPGNGPQSGRFLLQPVSERQNKEEAPRDCLWGGRMPGEALAPCRRGGRAPEQPGDSSTVLSDHCYCSVGGERPHALRDHDYCRRVLASTRLLLDHQYCCVPRVNCQELCRAPRTSGTNRAGRREPAGRHSRIQRLVRKAKWTLWRREAGMGPADPRGSSWHTSHCGRMLSMYLRVEMLRPRGRRSRVMSGGASESPAVVSEPPTLDTAGEAGEEVEVPSAVRMQAERGEHVNPSYLSQLRDTYDVMPRTVGCTFCHNLEHSGCLLRKDVRPVSVGLNG